MISEKDAIRAAVRSALALATPNQLHARALEIRAWNEKVEREKRNKKARKVLDKRGIRYD